MSNSSSLKRIIKQKLKSNKKLTELEQLRENLKYEIAEELGLKDKVDKYGWSGLTASETGKIGGIMTKRKKELNVPKNSDILNNSKG
ncbi:small, acid-soluble spore protein, alpha/beta type [Candidatus Arthromitus sp. SFB-rat-Yit]|uniref:small, acid-soluble spore protein, alpha/beta type n=1 Tax=Candidatus Arthromitus sp. SFB-rat-Yit TaxID=1041504 RepID=UPI000682231D|nr:small, acid-soluble spore protein, alpha/beta type [Candidatus Arthromitus sp. SFB-rat-Yit]